ncbi:hypothetical protein SAY86_017135 [Trapa natans]|uniref:G-patch domain-containing protein n=1 Tax=Trapa natans TaxID=22666 RepID=A0AAN7M4Q6_TRANT|nr:hypothetical protein SAY86_017135 [Trapa natans]
MAIFYFFVCILFTELFKILSQLIGSIMDEADLPVMDVLDIKSGNRGNKAKKVHGSLKRSAKNSLSKNGETRDERIRKRLPLSSQPVSFVSSGVMKSGKTEVGVYHAEEMNQNDSENKGKIGVFEEHTKGFGSRVMAKMGYIEGKGLGKDGKGMAEPIEVIKRPKSLGLGMNFLESGEESERKSRSHTERIDRSSSSKKVPNNDRALGMGLFERHTRGFGSKMMAKMGFVEGMGLGRDSQGMLNPLVAVRLPKSRGLGASG